MRAESKFVAKMNSVNLLAHSIKWPARYTRLSKAWNK